MAAKMFRVILHVGDLAKAQSFYERLLGARGRTVGGGRVYLDCGPVILALLQPGGRRTSIPENLYFAVDDLKAFHARARELDALSAEDVHGDSAGAIAKRPWGERSFYANDPWGNGLCFVDKKTIFTGKQPRR